MPEGGLFEPSGALIRKVDSQGRIALPQRMAEELGSTAVVSPGLAGCIELRRPDEWKRYEARFLALDMMDPDAAELYRHLVAPAEMVTLDAQNRMRIPEALLRHAKLNGGGKEAQIIRMPGRWEIWDAERFVALSEERGPILQEIARRVFGRQSPNGGEGPR